MTDRAGIFSGPVIMLFSAALFGYFGFMMSWAHQYTTTNPPQLLVMVVILEWAFRGGAIAFLVSGIVAMVRLNIANLVYSVAGLVTAVMFLAVAIWDWTNPQGYYSGVPAILLLIFAAWNGYGSITGLRAVLAVRAERESFGPPE